MVFSFQHALALLTDARPSGNLMFAQSLATAQTLTDPEQLGQYLDTTSGVSA
jgi:hypothetical protein